MAVVEPIEFSRSTVLENERERIWYLCEAINRKNLELQKLVKQYNDEDRRMLLIQNLLAKGRGICTYNICRRPMPLDNLHLIYLCGKAEGFAHQFAEDGLYLLCEPCCRKALEEGLCGNHGYPVKIDSETKELMVQMNEVWTPLLDGKRNVLFFPLPPISLLDLFDTLYKSLLPNEPQSRLAEGILGNLPPKIEVIRSKDGRFEITLGKNV